MVRGRRITQMRSVRDYRVHFLLIGSIVLIGCSSTHLPSECGPSAEQAGSEAAATIEVEATWQEIRDQQLRAMHALMGTPPERDLVVIAIYTEPTRVIHLDSYAPLAVKRIDPPREAVYEFRAAVTGLTENSIPYWWHGGKNSYFIKVRKQDACRARDILMSMKRIHERLRVLGERGQEP